MSPIYVSLNRRRDSVILIRPDEAMLFRKTSKIGDLIFAFFHLLSLLAILVFGLLGLIHGNFWRFGLIMAGLAIYYFFVLHKGVRAEIARRKKLKESP